MQFPVAAVFQRKARIRDLDLAVRRAVDQIVDHLGHRAEMFGQRRGIFVQRGKHEAAIDRDAADPLHVVLRIVETEGVGIALAMRHRVERAVRPERPGMIRATEHLGVAAIDHADSRAAMRAAILQHVDVAVGVAGDQDLVGGEPGADEVAGLLELAFMGDVDPEPAEDALLLELEHRRRPRRRGDARGPAAPGCGCHRTSEAWPTVPCDVPMPLQFNSPPKASAKTGDLLEAGSRRVRQRGDAVVDRNAGGEPAEQRRGVHRDLGEAEPQARDRVHRQQMPGMRRTALAAPAVLRRDRRGCADIRRCRSSARCRIAGCRDPFAARRSE